MNINEKVEIHAEHIGSLLGQHPQYFLHGCHVQMLIDRSIGNTNKGSRRWVNKLISFDRANYINNCKKLLHQMYYVGEPDIRLYASCNDRNLYSAANKFHHAFIDKSGNEEFLGNLHNNWVSALMAPESKYNQFYLIDYDHIDPRPIKAAIPPDNLVLEYPTVKGWHFIVTGFDMRPIKDMQHVDIKRDGLILLATWKDLE